MTRKRTNHSWDAVPPSDNCVTIFGAGIAGLTAAHELCERGFQVQVWEEATDPRYPKRGCDIGGMARTQWSRVHWPDARSLDRFQPLSEDELSGSIAGRQTQPIVHLPQRLVIDSATQLELKLSQAVSARSDSFAEEALLTEEPAKTDLARGASGLDISVRGWEGMSEVQRQDFASRAAEALREHVSKLADAVPFFDRRTRLWTLSAGSEAPATQFSAIFTGEFPSHLPAGATSPRVSGYAPSGSGAAVREAESSRRIPADVFALVRRWTQGKPSYEMHDDVRALFSVWTPGELCGIGAYGSRNLDVILAEIVDVLEKNRDIRHVYVEVCDRDFAKLSSRERLERAKKVAQVVEEHLPQADGRAVSLAKFRDIDDARDPHRIRSALIYAPQGYDQRDDEQPDAETLVSLEIVPLAEFPEVGLDEIQVLIGFRIRERWLPGEHGYRFFPAFYRHLYDTMRRTPILEATDKTAFSQEQERAVSVATPEKARYVETARTAFDNIHPTTSHVLAFSHHKRPAVLSRAKPKSLEELRQYVQILFGTPEEGGFETEPRESTRFSLKFLQYLTSGPTRRKRLETSSWWDFVEGDRYSDNVRRLIEKWPEALVAMDARRADARTHGNAMVQLVLDNLSSLSYRDGTLRGPTSEAWLIHWRRYLEAQGVEFIHGKLVGIELSAEGATGAGRPWPKVRCYEPRYVQQLGQEVPLMPGYFILATSAPSAQKLAQEFRERAKRCTDLLDDSESDLAHTAQLAVGDVEAANPRGDLRHFAGIQFYFAEDVFGVDGHVYYPDSPWGLTSISQARFWEDRTDWEHGYRGVLSAIIGIWDAPGQFNRKIAWECPPEELATEVWRQIKSSVASRRAGKQSRRDSTIASAALDGIPDPLYFHLDDSMKWQNGRYENSMPFHIASPTGWQARPGDPEAGFRVEHGWVVCGMYTKTFTRAPCMESANESGRHAVNAILEHLGSDRRIEADGHSAQAGGGGVYESRFRNTRCQVFDPEDYEVDDLRWFKELDEKLAQRGLPHFLEILGVDRYVDGVLRGGPDDPLDPLNVMRSLGRMGSGFKSLFSSFRRPGY